MSSRRRVAPRVIVARHAARIRRSCTSSATERRAWPGHADGFVRAEAALANPRNMREVLYSRPEGRRETRDVPITSRHPSSTAVIVVVRSPSPSSSSLIRRVETRQHAFDSRAISRIGRMNTWIIVEPEVETGPDYSLRSRSDGLVTCVTAMTVPTATAFERLPLSVSVRPSFLLVSRSRYRPSRASSHPCEFNAGLIRVTPTFSDVRGSARRRGTSAASSPHRNVLSPALNSAFRHAFVTTHYKSVFFSLLISNFISFTKI